MANKTHTQPTKSCSDCVHEYACRMWTDGRKISDESASRCTNHTTTKESAAYLIGKMDGEKTAIPVDEHRKLLREMYLQGKFDGAVEAEEAAKVTNTADVAPRAEWISVEERLPDCEYGAETEALLFRLKTGTVEAGYFGTGGRFRDKYFRCYHHANEGWDAKDVTHWMHLPDPPKGD